MKLIDECIGLHIRVKYKLYNFMQEYIKIMFMLQYLYYNSHTSMYII